MRTDALKISGPQQRMLQLDQRHHPGDARTQGNRPSWSQATHQRALREGGRGEGRQRMPAEPFRKVQAQPFAWLLTFLLQSQFCHHHPKVPSGWGGSSAVGDIRPKAGNDTAGGRWLPPSHHPAQQPEELVHFRRKETRAVKPLSPQNAKPTPGKGG